MIMPSWNIKIRDSRTGIEKVLMDGMLFEIFSSLQDHGFLSSEWLQRISDSLVFRQEGHAFGQSSSVPFLRKNIRRRKHFGKGGIISMPRVQWKYSMVNPETKEEIVLVGSEWKAVLSLQAYGDMILAAQECPVEVGGKHRVLIDRERSIFYVPQIWIPSQTCTEGSFTLTAEDEMAASTEAEARGLNWDEFRLGYWHSHVDMPARLSGQDLWSTEKHMEFYHDDWVKSEYPWRDHEIQIEFVVNRRGNISARFSSAVPQIGSLRIPVEFDEGVTRESLREYAANNRERIRRIVFERVRVKGGSDEDD